MTCWHPAPDSSPSGVSCLSVKTRMANASKSFGGGADLSCVTAIRTPELATPSDPTYGKLRLADDARGEAGSATIYR